MDNLLFDPMPTKEDKPAFTRTLEIVSAELLPDNPLSGGFLPEHEEAQQILAKLIPEEKLEELEELEEQITENPVRVNKRIVEKLQRPVFGTPIFDNPTELMHKLEEYFETWKAPDLDKFRQDPPSIASLALFLNISKKQLLAYESKPGYGPIVEAAKTHIEAYLETLLTSPWNKNSKGIAFSLKNNFDWKEKVENSGDFQFSITRTLFSDQTKTLNNDSTT